jgi:hypothetical protein
LTTSQYLLGVAELAVIAAALGLGAFYVRELLVPSWSGALARLAEFILALSALVVIAEFLGVLKLLEEVPLVIACGVVGVGSAIWARGRGAHEEPESPAVKPTVAMLIVAVFAAGVVVAHWSEPTWEAVDTGMYFQDTTWYHMSFSGRFAQTGEVGPLHFTDPLKLVAWFYPQNNELLHGVGMVSMDTDLLSPLVNLGFLAASLLAAWCIGRPYAVGAVTVLGAAVVLDSGMLVDSQAGNAPNDIGGLFFLLAVIAFLVNGAATARAAPDLAGAEGPPPRAVRDEDTAPDFDPEADEEHPQSGVVAEVPVAGDPRVLAGIGAGPLFLAGLAAGLGIGTKITLLATLGVLTVGLAILAGRRGWLRAMGIWLGAILITAGFWYGRNLWHAVNPLPQIEKIGPINLPGPDQGEFYPRQPHSLSEYYNDVGVWKDFFFPVLEERLGPLWPLILAAAAASLIGALIWGGSRLLRLLAITGTVAGIAYVFTPLTASGGLGEPTGFDANLRYVGPALILAFVLAPLVPALRRRPWPWVLIGVFAVFILQGAFLADDLGGLTIPRSWDFGHHDESLEMALLLIGVPALIVFGARTSVPRWALAAFGALALVLTVALGNTQREEYLEDRYDAFVAPPLETGFRSTDEWKPIQQFGKETTDSRIGVVGRAAAFGQYFFYGDDLSNHVQYLGNELRRGTFRQISSCRLLREVINEGDYDYVVITPRLRREEQKPPETLWVGADRAATPIVRSDPARIFRLNGPLDPASCAKLKQRAFS